MSGLPLHVKAAKYFDVLRENGLCIRSVLATVIKADLMEIGLNLGHAKVVLAALFPQVAQVVVVPPVVAPKYVRTNPAPDFPPVGGTGLPAPRDLRAWMVKVYDTLRERGVPTADLKEVQLQPKTAIRADWVDGTDVDQAYWTVLTRCGKAGLPTDLVLSFPAVVRDGELGLKAWKHLFERVFLTTDASITALQKWFDNPPSAKQGAQLLQMLTRWINLVEELAAAGCAPWDPAKRASLEKVYSGVEAAKRAAEALEALYDEVSVDRLL